MIVTRPIALRVALVIVLAVILQAAFFSPLTILGASPNVIGVVVVSLGLLGGGVVGAVCGFATGFLLDSLLLQTLGVSSLVLLSIGFLAGRYRESFEVGGRWTAPLLAGAFTFLAASGFAALQLMLGVESAVSLLVLREIVVQALLAVGLAFALFPLIRRLLAPALIDYTPSPRRARVPEFLARRLRARAVQPPARRSPQRRGTVVAAHPPERVRGSAARRRAGGRQAA